MDVLSPLTKASNVSLVEIIRTNDLVKIYKNFQFDIKEELQGIQEIGLYHCHESDWLCQIWRRSLEIISQL